MDVLIGRVDAYKDNYNFQVAGDIEGLCTHPEDGVFPNLYEREEDGEKLYYVQAANHKEDVTEEYPDISEALEDWVRLADSIAEDACDSVADNLYSEVFNGYNCAIYHHYKNGKWTYTVQFENMGDTWDDPQEYSSLDEIKASYEKFNNWLVQNYGDGDKMESILIWIKNLFNAGKTPATATMDGSASKSSAVPAGHVVAPLDWVRKPGEQDKLRRLQAALQAAENDPTNGQFAKYLSGILK